MQCTSAYPRHTLYHTQEKLLLTLSTLCNVKYNVNEKYLQLLTNKTELNYCGCNYTDQQKKDLTSKTNIKVIILK